MRSNISPYGPVKWNAEKMAADRITDTAVRHRFSQRKISRRSQYHLPGKVFPGGKHQKRRHVSHGEIKNKAPCRPLSEHAEEVVTLHHGDVPILLLNQEHCQEHDDKRDAKNIKTPLAEHGEKLPHQDVGAVPEGHHLVAAEEQHHHLVDSEKRQDKNKTVVGRARQFPV